MPSHQASDTIRAGRLGFIRQILVHTRRTDGAFAVLVDFSNASKQTLMVDRARTR